MLRSLFSGISGLNAHQQMIDVAANNIANVNTAGFKASSVVFEDTLSQTLASGSQGGATTGGTNPIQIGLGVTTAATNLDFTQGAPQATGVPSNLMINGDGFFIVSKGGQQMFTRAGEFTRDTNGHLVSPDGSLVCDNTGTPLDLSALDSGTYVSYSIGQDGAVNAVNASGATVKIAQIGLATFSNPNGLVKAGDNNYMMSASSGAAVMGTPGTGSMGSLTPGYVEGSNVDLSKELTSLIVAERGFQANSKSITTSDEILQTLVNLKN